VVHAQDTMLKFLQAGLAPKGVAVAADADGPLGVNQLNVLFLASAPVLRTNPAWHELLVSLDIVADSDAAQRGRRKAAVMARLVDEVLTSFAVPKQNFASPSAPTGMGTFLLPDYHGSWRRVADPESRYEHLNRTLTVRYFEEAR